MPGVGPPAPRAVGGGGGGGGTSAVGGGGKLAVGGVEGGGAGGGEGPPAAGGVESGGAGGAGGTLAGGVDAGVVDICPAGHRHVLLRPPTQPPLDLGHDVQQNCRTCVCGHHLHDTSTPP